jgi:Dolichyl-phosphate-mannose-protein mannosyltransferase
MLIPGRSGAAVAEARPAPLALRISPETWLLVGLTLLAAALRFATLTSQSYWVDESQAVHEFQLSFGGMLTAWSHSEGNPPLYFIVGWGWAGLFGTGEAGLRSLSAVAGTALIPVAYLCGRELVSRRAGLVAAALAAVNPFLIWYSQEAREYMLLALLCGGSLLFLARSRKAPTRRNLALWALLSALALLTQYFAGFLVAAEALALLHRVRTRASIAAVAAVAAVEVALIPHVLDNITNQLQWIVALPLSLRIRQVPVAFAMNTLDQSSAINYSLIGAAVLAAIVIALLVAGADGPQLRGAALAAALAAAVLLAPLLLALAGHDNYVVRGLIPAWIPLAVVVAAACTPTHARLAGAGLAVVLLALFVYADIRINDSVQYQRPNWRGVAEALGSARSPRAILAGDGEFAAGPLSIYLPGVPWAGPGQSAQLPAQSATVSELDLVASSSDTLRGLPPGTRVLARRMVDGYLVVRLALATPWSGSGAALQTRANQLLNPPAAAPELVIQRPSA